MSNATAFESLNAQAQYGREGLAKVLAMVKRVVGQYELNTDALVVTRLTATAVAAGGETAAWTNAAVRVYLAWAESPSTATSAAVVQFYKTSTASVTQGTTMPALAFPLPFGKSSGVLLFPGNDDTNFPALSYTVAIATGLSAANATNAPTVTVLTNK